MNLTGGNLKMGLATVLLAGLLTLTGCSDSDGTDSSDLRVIHSSVDAPTVNVRVGNKTPISDLDYAESSGYVEVRSGAREVVVEAMVLGGNVDVITVDRFEFEKDKRYNILAVNEAADIDALVVEESAADPGLTEVAVAIVHAASVAGLVEIFVTEPGAALSNPIPLDYLGSADAGALPVDTYQIRVTLGGTLVYDSGPVDLSGFAGDKLLIAALNSSNTTDSEFSPIKLLVANDITQVVLPDVMTQVGARVLHLSPDAGPVDVFANGGILTRGLEYTQEFPGASVYAKVPVDEYTFDVVAPSSPTSTAADSIYSATLALAGGVEYSVIALGNAADGLTGPGNGTEFGLLPIVDDNRPLADLARVKILHGAPDAGLVDVYVTPAGVYSANDVLAGIAGDPLLPDFAFGSLTDYLAVAAGDYDIRILQKSSGLIAIDAPGITLKAGLVATVIARQPNGAGVNPVPADFNLVVLANVEAAP